MSVEEAGAWADAWLASSRPSSIGPWVSAQRDAGVKYDAITQSIVESPTSDGPAG